MFGSRLTFPLGLPLAGIRHTRLSASRPHRRQRESPFFAVAAKWREMKPRERRVFDLRSCGGNGGGDALGINARLAPHIHPEHDRSPAPCCPCLPVEATCSRRATREDLAAPTRPPACSLSLTAPLVSSAFGHSAVPASRPHGRRRGKFFRSPSRCSGSLVSVRSQARFLHGHCHLPWSDIPSFWMVG